MEYFMATIHFSHRQPLIRLAQQAALSWSLLPIPRPLYEVNFYDFRF
jgi:hypothetical protein